MNEYQSGTIAWLRGAGDLIVRASAGSRNYPWDSAVTRLITGINSEFGEERYRLLRKRIYTTSPVSEWDRNLVKVCAKRIATNHAPPPSAHREIDVGRDLVLDPSSDRRGKWPGGRVQPQEIITWLASVVEEEAEAARSLRRHQAPRLVAAALVDAAGNLLAANVNTNSHMQVRHAEVNLLLELASRGIAHIPHGANIYVSLKPCRMCASLINALSQTRDPVRIFALKDDPGPHGRHGMLPGLELS